MTQEREGAITLHGQPMTLVGRPVAVGDLAADFEVLANDLSPLTLGSFAGKTLILLAVPSLDTPVCDTEVRRFNEGAAALGDGVAVLVVSMDLPFAQQRWCGAAGVERVQTASDHRAASFGLAYGLLIKELRLLARAVIVIDREGKARHVELVEEVTEEPDYAAALAAAQGIV